MIKRLTSIFVEGPPGAGKTTAGKLIAALFPNEFRFLDMSTVCSVASSFVPSLASSFAQHQSAGTLVPDEVIMPHFSTYLGSFPADTQFVFSGIFRTADQVDFAYDHIPHFRDRSNEMIVLQIQLSGEEAFKRCKNRGELLSTHGKQGARKTDLDPELNRRRVEIYNQNSDKVISALSRRQLRIQIVQVPSLETPDATFRKIVEALGVKDLVLEL